MHQEQRNRHLRIACTKVDDLIFGRKQFCHVKIDISSDISFHAWLRFVFMIHWLPLFMRSRSRSALFAAAFLTLLSCTNLIRAQTDDAFGDAAADPVKLFERGQAAHARGDLVKALEIYEEAVKLRPELAEAEFQRGNALVGISCLAEAESCFGRGIEIRIACAHPY